MKLVIKIGGSLAFNDFGPNRNYLKRLIPVLKDIDRKHHLIVCIGGGQFIRKYLKNIRNFILTDKEMEWLFVELLRTNVSLFSFLLDKKPIFDIKKVNARSEGIIGGISPGRSTDSNAALCAEKIRADLFIKATDVDGIYNKDPKKDKNAKKIDNIGFKDLKKFKQEGKPCSYGILDRLAMNVVARSRIKTIILNGKNPKNILRAVNGKKIGTLVS